MVSDHTAEANEFAATVAAVVVAVRLFDTSRGALLVVLVEEVPHFDRLVMRTGYSF